MAVPSLILRYRIPCIVYKSDIDHRCQYQSMCIQCYCLGRLLWVTNTKGLSKLVRCEGLTDGTGQIDLVVDNDCAVMTKEEWDSNYPRLIGMNYEEDVFCNELRLSSWQNWKGVSHNLNDDYSSLSNKLGVMSQKEWNGERWFFL